MAENPLGQSFPIHRESSDSYTKLLGHPFFSYISESISSQVCMEFMDFINEIYGIYCFITISNVIFLGCRIFLLEQAIKVADNIPQWQFDPYTFER